MSRTGFDSTELPALTPRTHCVLIPRDPNYIYAYWDYTQADIARLFDAAGSERGDAQLVLRVYDTTLIHFDGSNAHHTWDIDTGFSTKSWYIQVLQDNADYCAELGVRLKDGHFIPLTRSNTVHTPPRSASSRNDLIWQDIKNHKESMPYLQEEIKVRGQKRPVAKKGSSARIYRLTVQDIRDYYMKLFASVSPRGRRKAAGRSIENILKGKLSAIAWQKVTPFVKRSPYAQSVHLGASMMGALDEQPGASENLMSAQTGGGSEVRLAKRKFFFEIWTELLVYGRTESDAVVKLNEKGVKLNPDGTFSLRYALPDGEIPLKFIAQSSDGVEQRHINTRVEREKTVGFPKFLKDFNG